MRIRNSRAHRWSVVAALVALLAACAATPTQTPVQPQRTYGFLREPELVVPLLESTLTNAGYGFTRCSLSRVCRETSWKEYDGEPRGQTRSRERRMYTAWFLADPTQAQYMFFLRLVVEERLPGSSAWTVKQVAPQQDAEYQRILQQMDIGIKKIGGAQV